MDNNRTQTYVHTFVKYLVFFAIGAFIFVYGIRFVQWLYHPFSNSYEEYGTVATMNCYLEGVNPFSFESFPEKTFIYGPLYAGFCALIYILFGLNCDHLLFCRIVSIIFLLGTEILALIIINRRLNPDIFKSRKFILCIVAFEALLPTAWQITPISGYSNTFGVFLTALIYLIITGKDRNKIWSLTLCSFLSVLAFFVKPYFVMVFGVALVQLILQRKKRQTCFLFLTFALFSIIAFNLCQVYMPTCLYVLVEAMSHQNLSIIHCIKQFTIFLLFYAPFFIALIYILNTDTTAFHQVPATYKSGILVAIISLLILGCNEGAYLWYFYHLLLLPLVICGIIAISFMKAKWSPILLFACIVLSVYHINLGTVAPAYPKNVTVELKEQLMSLENEYDLSLSYNFHASLDDWAAKKGMGYVNSLYPNFLLMMKDKENVLLFKKEHEKALPLLKDWEQQLQNNISNKKAQLIICKSNDEVLEQCGLKENYQLIRILNNPDGDPKYLDIDIYVKK